jgi:hypothetical protein
MQPPDDGANESEEESPTKAAGPLSKFKKSPSQIKIEYLSKLFQTNTGGASINDRALKSPHPRMTKKL